MIYINVDNNIYNSNSFVEKYKNRKKYCSELKSIYYNNDNKILIVNSSENYELNDGIDLNLVPTRELIDLCKIYQWSVSLNKIYCDSIYISFNIKNLNKYIDKKYNNNEKFNNIYNFYNLNKHLNKKIKHGNYSFDIRSNICSITLSTTNTSSEKYNLFFDVNLNIYFKTITDKNYKYLEDISLLSMVKYNYLLNKLNKSINSFKFNE